MDITRLDSLIKAIDDSIGRNEDDLNMFEFLIDNHFDSEVSNNKDYFKDRPDLLAINNEQIIFDIQNLIAYFLDKEEYEKCGRLKHLLNNYK